MLLDHLTVKAGPNIDRQSTSLKAFHLKIKELTPTLFAYRGRIEYTTIDGRQRVGVKF